MEKKNSYFAGGINFDPADINSCGLKPSADGNPSVDGDVVSNDQMINTDNQKYTFLEKGWTPKPSEDGFIA